MRISSFGRWMPTSHYPVAANQQSVWIVTQMERCNRRTPYLGQPADTHSVCTPPKVCKPLVATRVKQRHSYPCLRIDRSGFVAFESVTNRTSKPEIVFLIGPTLRNRNDVFNFEPCHHEMLRAKKLFEKGGRINAETRSRRGKAMQPHCVFSASLHLCAFALRCVGFSNSL